MLYKYAEELQSCAIQATTLKTGILGSPDNKYNKKANEDLRNKLNYLANNLKEFAQRL